MEDCGVKRLLNQTGKAGDPRKLVLASPSQAGNGYGAKIPKRTQLLKQFPAGAVG